MSVVNQQQIFLDSSKIETFWKLWIYYSMEHLDGMMGETLFYSSFFGLKKLLIFVSKEDKWDESKKNQQQNLKYISFEPTMDIVMLQWHWHFFESCVTTIQWNIPIGMLNKIFFLHIAEMKVKRVNECNKDQINKVSIINVQLQKLLKFAIIQSNSVWFAIQMKPNPL